LFASVPRRTGELSGQALAALLLAGICVLEALCSAVADYLFVFFVY
jgi:hypothetical protein